jgi:hypothetical protein
MRTSGRLLVRGGCVAAIMLCAGSAAGQAIVMGPGNTGFPFSVAPTGSNSIVQGWSTGDPTPYLPPLVYTDDLIANSVVTQLDGGVFTDGSFTFTNHADAGAYSTTATTSTISGSIQNYNGFLASGGSTVTSYCGSSQFYVFSLPTAANVMMTWSTSVLSGSSPSSGVMFWDLYQNSPTPGSVASVNNVDSGTWSATIPAGQYTLVYTRHDGITGDAPVMESNVYSQFTLVAEVVGLGALVALRRRR